MSIPASAAYVVERALSRLAVPPHNDPQAVDEVLAEWSALLAVVTAAAAELGPQHPVAVQLHAAAELVDLDLGRWRTASRIDALEHAELTRTVRRFAARCAQGEAFDEFRWEHQAWWERAQEATARWMAGAAIAEHRGASLVLALTSAALQSTDPRTVHDVLAAYLPGNHIRPFSLRDGDQLDLDVGYVVLHDWLAERLTHPDAVNALTRAFQTVEDPTTPEVPAQLLLRDGLPGAVSVLKAQ